MFTNLEKQQEKDLISMKELIEGQKERTYFGVCKSDLRDFSAYLDEVILNALEDLANDEFLNVPEHYSKEEWLGIITKMIDLAQGIVTNNYNEYNSSYEIENIEAYSNKIDMLEADSYALRCELYKMLGENIADLYTL